MAAAEAGEAEQGYGKHYVMLGLALACATLSYADRQVIALVVKPVKAAFDLSDTQIGLLQGIAFSLCYAIAGLPLAWAADRWNRVRLASGLVVVWSLATASCGLVTSYLGLIAARALTATSEAGFSPAVQSIMADRFPPNRIARVSAIYLLGPGLGIGFAMFGGGMILQYLETQGGLALGGMMLAPWQALFVCIGAPGLLLALIFFLVVREPVRTNAAFAARGGGTQQGSLSEALKGTGDFLIPYVVGSTTWMLIQYAQSAWAPTFFERSWHFAAHSAGQTLGPIAIACSIAGAVCASVAAKAETGQKALERVVNLALVGALILGPSAVLFPLVSNLTLALVLYGGLAFGFSLIASVATAPMLLVLPGTVRGRAIATGGFLLAVVGGGGGPLPQLSALLSSCVQGMCC
jgi:MFS family permease